MKVVVFILAVAFGAGHALAQGADPIGRIMSIVPPTAKVQVVRAKGSAPAQSGAEITLDDRLVMPAGARVAVLLRSQGRLLDLTTPFTFSKKNLQEAVLKPLTLFSYESQVASRLLDGAFPVLSSTGRNYAGDKLIDGLKIEVTERQTVSITWRNRYEGEGRIGLSVEAAQLSRTYAETELPLGATSFELPAGTLPTRAEATFLLNIFRVQKPLVDDSITLNFRMPSSQEITWADSQFEVARRSPNSKAKALELYGLALHLNMIYLPTKAFEVICEADKAARNPFIADLKNALRSLLRMTEKDAQ